MKLLAILASCLACLSLIGCGPQALPPEEPTQPPYLGQINSVHSAQNFVLIRRAPGVTIPTGTILISKGPGGRVANLRITGESLGEMIAADIQAGMPEVGDSVHQPLVMEPDAPDNPAPKQP